MSRPIALTVAGSDSSGGAGIQADLKTFSALGVYGASVITALTAQNTCGVDGVLPIPAGFVAQQLSSVFADLDVGAVKTGMLASSEIIEAVLDVLPAGGAPPIVVDPVMVATSGDRLINEDAITVVRDLLMPRAALITPNLAEAAVLLGQPEATNREQMEQQGRDLAERGAHAVLIKGGHVRGSEACDVLVRPDAPPVWFTAPWVDTPHTHGTGCTLSAAITAGLAGGRSLVAAIEHAKSYLTQALESGRNLGVGRGHGPVDHLCTWSAPD
jgi:hydroxymethylpyrimidine/phosphomethylpyrimidine kinase